MPPLVTRLRRLLSRAARDLRGWRRVVVLVSLALLVCFAIVTTEGPATAFAAAAAIGAVGLLLVATASETAGLRERLAAAEAAARPTKEPPKDRPSLPTTGARVAIVVTAFEEGDLLAECLRSIQAQTWTDWECVVMDDHSGDDTVEIALGSIAGDTRFRVITADRNSGLGRQRNAGAAATGAPFLTFLDGDDLLYPEGIRSRVLPLSGADHPALAGVFCNWVEVDSRADMGAPPRRNRRPRVTWLRGTSVEGVPFIASAPMLRREAFVAVGGFRPLPVSEDVDLWQRMLRRGFFFEGVRDVGVAYRQRPGSWLREGALDSARSIAALVAANGEPLDEPGAVGPWVHAEPFPVYPPRMMFVRRLVRAAAFQVAAGEPIDALVGDIGEAFEGHMEWTLDMDRLIRSVSRLAALATAESLDAQGEIGAHLTSALAPLVSQARAEASAWTAQPPEHALDVGDAVRTVIEPGGRPPR